MRQGKTLLAIGLAAAASAAAAAPAAAHVDVASTKPSAGGSAKTSLRMVKVSFDGQLRSGTLKVKRRGGGKVSRGKGGRDPRNVRRLSVRLKGGLKPGRYKARWTIVAADGHEQRGAFKFRLKR